MHKTKMIDHAITPTFKWKTKKNDDDILRQRRQQNQSLDSLHHVRRTEERPTKHRQQQEQQQKLQKNKRKNINMLPFTIAQQKHAIASSFDYNNVNDSTHYRQQSSTSSSKSNQITAVTTLSSLLSLSENKDNANERHCIPHIIRKQYKLYKQQQKLNHLTTNANANNNNNNNEQQKSKFKNYGEPLQSGLCADIAKSLVVPLPLLQHHSSTSDTSNTGMRPITSFQKQRQQRHQSSAISKRTSRQTPHQPLTTIGSILQKQHINFVIDRIETQHSMENNSKVFKQYLNQKQSQDLLRLHKKQLCEKKRNDALYMKHEINEALQRIQRQKKLELSQKRMLLHQNNYYHTPTDPAYDDDDDDIDNGSDYDHDEENEVYQSNIEGLGEPKLNHSMHQIKELDDEENEMIGIEQHQQQEDEMEGFGINSSFDFMDYYGDNSNNDIGVFGASNDNKFTSLTLAQQAAERIYYRNGRKGELRKKYKGHIETKKNPRIDPSSSDDNGMLHPSRVRKFSRICENFPFTNNNNNISSAM